MSILTLRLSRGRVASGIGWPVTTHDPLVPVETIGASDLQVAVGQTLIIFGAVRLVGGELALGTIGVFHNRLSILEVHQRVRVPR